jgi:hypothetical protein
MQPRTDVFSVQFRVYYTYQQQQPPPSMKTLHIGEGEDPAPQLQFFTYFITTSQLFCMSHSLYATTVTNFAADYPFSKLSINSSSSLLNSNCLTMSMYITAKYTMKIKG